jgi:hypothetical protein
MRAKRAAQWNIRMLETFNILMHAKSGHHTLGAQILHRGKRDDFSQAKHFECDAKGRSCCLGCVTFTPIGIRKTPTNLDARRKRKFGCGEVQANKSNEFRASQKFYRPQSPTPSGNERLQAVRQRVALGALERAGKNAMTLASSFSRENGSRSLARHCRKCRRSVLISMGFVIVAIAGLEGCITPTSGSLRLKLRAALEALAGALWKSFCCGILKI